jgi:deoxyribonuclease (pyrimidine dimer)
VSVTRINLVPVKELSRQHLVAEYREITRLPANLNKSLNRQSKSFCMSEIPDQYVLGAGHVKHFFNKMLYLQKRFESLVQEMLKRGYNVTYTDSSIFANCPPEFYNDYTPTEADLELNRKRILERTVIK